MATDSLAPQAHVGSGLFLQPDVAITLGTSGLILSRKGVPVHHHVGVAEGLILTFLGATGDPVLAAKYGSEVLGDDSGAKWTQQVLNRYWTYLGNGPARPLDIGWLRDLPSRQLLVRQAHTRDAAPASITWLTTLACNRHCLYCFYDVTHFSAPQQASPPDSSFPLPQVVRMVREMAQIGTADLFLTGGEPLLRKDLPAILQAASSVRVRTHLVTKYHVDRALAHQLAQAGIWSVTVSLDDARPRESAVLTGARGYLKQATDTIASLLDAGVRVELNAVATSLNLEHLEALVQLAVNLGVAKVSVSPLIPPVQRPAVHKLLPPIRSVEEAVAKLQQEYGHRLELVLGPADAVSDRPAARDGQLVCEVGLRTLHVLPDGQATRCHYLPARQDLQVGSLRSQTIMEIWEGARLRNFCEPTPQAYTETDCAECRLFDACNARGRCYYSSLLKSDRLYAPDDFCGRRQGA